MYKIIIFVGLFASLCVANVVPTLNKPVDNIYNEKIVEGFIVKDRQAKGLKWSTLNELWSCGAEVKCWFDRAEMALDATRNAILAQADTEVSRRSLGRKTDDTPTALANTVQKIINEISEAIRSGLAGFFRGYKEYDEKSENGIQEEEENENEESRGLNGESRKKKKKKEKIKAIIKLLILGVVLKAKLTILLQLLSAALQVKFFLIALAGLLLNAARFWFEIKKGHHPQKVIYYEHAQHQHHYEHEDEHGGWWGRAYDEEEKDGKTGYKRVGENIENNKRDGLYAQEIAYRGQKPTVWAP